MNTAVLIVEPARRPFVDETDAVIEFARMERELLARIHTKMIAEQLGQAFEDLETIAP